MNYPSRETMIEFVHKYSNAKIETLVTCGEKRLKMLFDKTLEFTSHNSGDVVLEEEDVETGVVVKVPKKDVPKLLAEMQRSFLVQQEIFPKSMSNLEASRLEAFIEIVNKNKDKMNDGQWEFCKSLISMQSVLFNKPPLKGTTLKKLDKLSEYVSRRYCENCKDQFCCNLDESGEEKCFFHDGKCTIYDIRPLHCRKYICNHIDPENVAKLLKVFGLGDKNA